MTAYYNEHDPFAAAWLRELIKAGHIPAGDVDERSIEDVTPDEIKSYDQCHFFAGIGGWPHALRLAGWPDDRPVWTGSAPCQPFSAAGKGGGFSDERHLWPAFLWLISQQRPATIFGEQVASKAGRDWFDVVSSDLEAHGYAVGAADLCAAGVGAPHIRQRLYFVADACDDGHDRPQARTAQPGSDKPGNGIFVGGDIKAVSLADADQLGRRGRRASKAGDKPGKEQRPGRLRDVGSLDNADGRRYGPKETIRSGRGIAELSDDKTIRLGNPGGAGLAQRQSIGGNDKQKFTPAQRAGGDFWSDLEWLPCIDGKARPTQPGLFPLAHGVPARVGRLRGYGNAIVPPLAAEFIKAYMEAAQ